MTEGAGDRAVGGEAQLARHIRAVEQQLGAKLEWIEAKKACRAVQRRENADIDNEAGIAALFDWLIERAAAFEKVFSPMVKKFKAEE